MKEKRPKDPLDARVKLEGYRGVEISLRTYQEIADSIRQNPQLSAEEIARQCNCGVGTVKSVQTMEQGKKQSSTPKKKFGW